MRERSGAVTLLLLVSAIRSPAETAPPGSADAAAESFLAERVAHWQRRLNLEEWTITVSLMRRAHLKAGTLAGIKWDKGKRTAAIWVLDPADYRMKPEEMWKDMEFTVVHELIHLELASLPKSEASRRVEEQAVNNLARALLAPAHPK